MITQEKLEADGYVLVRQRDDGVWFGVKKMVFTTGIFVGLDDFFYEYRYCYRHPVEAATAAARWDGHGHPPGPWVSCKGRPGGDIQGPGARLPEPAEEALWLK